MGKLLVLAEVRKVQRLRRSTAQLAADAGAAAPQSPQHAAQEDAVHAEGRALIVRYDALLPTADCNTLLATAGVHAHDG